MGIIYRDWRHKLNSWLVMEVDELSSGSSWICQVCCSYYPRLFDLVSHTHSVHPVLNIKCGIDHCDKQVNKADSWYRQVRIHHSHHYNSTDSAKQAVASTTIATVTTGHSELFRTEGGDSDTETSTTFTDGISDSTISEDTSPMVDEF